MAWLALLLASPRLTLPLRLQGSQPFLQARISQQSPEKVKSPYFEVARLSPVCLAPAVLHFSSQPDRGLGQHAPYISQGTDFVHFLRFFKSTHRVKC